MTGKTCEVVMHVFAHEMQDFQRTVEQLKRNLAFVDEAHWHFDITLNVSEDKYDWKTSILNPSFFVEQFEDLCKMLPNTTTEIIWSGDYGCNSVRRKAARTSLCDYIGYLDLDLHFSIYTLHYIDNTIQTLGDEQIIVSGQIPRLWDDSWNIISNDEFVEMGVESKVWLKIDPYSIDKLVHKRLKDIELRALPYIKIGGGWMNFINQKLLNEIDVPDSLGAYGMDDTFVETACNLLVQHHNRPIKQYVVNNLLVCENRKYETFEPYLNSGYLMMHGDLEIYKKDMATKAQANYQAELQKLMEKY